MTWRTLHAGSLVGVVAPAGPGDPESTARVEPLLATFGLRTRLFPGCHACDGFLAGPDALRLLDLHAAFADPEVDAVWCLRGGYGSGRLLDRVDTALLRQHDKPFIGYSDITALHALRAREGLLGLHAPMPGSDLSQAGREGDASALLTVLREGWRAGHEIAPVLSAGTEAISTAVSALSSGVESASDSLANSLAGSAEASGAHTAVATLRAGGSAEGRLVGGNLSLVASLVGTPFAWNVRDSILFIEDIDEEPYRVDRLLGQLRLAGVLDAAKGFLLGSFTGEESPHEVLRDYLAATGKPVLGGWPAGHGTPHLPLPLGARVRMDATRGTLTLLQDVILP